MCMSVCLLMCMCTTCYVLSAGGHPKCPSSTDCWEPPCVFGTASLRVISLAPKYERIVVEFMPV